MMIIHGIYSVSGAIHQRQSLEYLCTPVEERDCEGNGEDIDEKEI